MPQPSPNPISVALPNRFSWQDACFAFGLLGLSPLIYQHALNLSQKAHFQFFPIAWGLFAYIVYSRAQLGQTAGKRRWFANAASLIALLLGAASVLWFSPWLAMVSLVSLCAGWMYHRLAGNPWYEPVAWLSLLLITLPMPLNLDQRLIQLLQSVSSRSASALLDVVSTPHLPMGNVIEIRTGKLFVDDACSGVDSLYALTAVALALLIWNKRDFVPSVLLLAMVPVWAWLGNTIRILSIAILLDRFDVDMSHGWPHTLLGLAVFGFASLSVLLTQEALFSLMTPFSNISVTSGPFHIVYNWLVSFPGKDPAKPNTNKPALKSRVATVDGSQSSVALTTAYCSAWIVLGGVAILPMTGQGLWTQKGVQTTSITQEDVKQTFAETLLPEDLSGMRRLNFQVVHRDRDDANGAHSATWQFLDGDQPVQVSIDFPFPSFHALEACYLLTGSSLMEPVTNTEVSFDPAPLTVTEARLVNAVADVCYVCYTAFDRNGMAVTGNESRLARGVMNDSSSRVSYQVQLFVDGCGTLTDAQRLRYRGILAEVSRKLLPAVQALPGQ